MSNWSAVKRIEGMEEGDESELGEKQQRLNALDVRGDFPVDPFQAPPRVKTSARSKRVQGTTSGCTD